MHNASVHAPVFTTFHHASALIGIIEGVVAARWSTHYYYYYYYYYY